MSNTLSAAWSVAVYLLQRLAIGVIAMVALALTAYWIACAVGSAPWLSLELRFGTYVVTEAGPLVQTAITVLVLTLLFYMPSHMRMMSLETSHRKFHMNMRDVARAYAASHKADREGVFTLSSEFDSIRDRIAFLRAHPDLEGMEADVMELAAQMSHISRELAQTYSDDNVARARDFLIQRQEDIAEFEDRVRLAKNMAEDLTRWRRRVELEESVAQSQLQQLREDLAEVLPELLEEPVTTDIPAEDPALPEPQEVAEADDRKDETEGAEAQPAERDLNDEQELYAEDDRIVALLARRASS